MKQKFGTHKPRQSTVAIVKEQERRRFWRVMISTIPLLVFVCALMAFTLWPLMT